VLRDKHIVLGVTGGIAAYKSALLVRELMRAGAEVQVVMTPAATHFVTPLTLGTLSRREVVLEMFPGSGGDTAGQWTRHIELGQWADAMLVAPASANTVAKIAHGFADNFLTTLALALRCPLILAPSMDVDMWRHAATQQNIATVRQRGCSVIEPEEGELASGLSGPGRLPEAATIVAFLEAVLARRVRDLAGKTVLVSAGPTQEPIDPVRYVGNRSSGKMGFAIARAAAERGAEVVLVAGPVDLETPVRTRRIDVETAVQMQEVLEREFAAADILVMAAAVADFSPALVSAAKIKRENLSGDRLVVELKKNPDILRGLGQRKKRQLLVGFALETENGIENAGRKLAEKNLDAIVLNDPTLEGAGFGSDTNVVTILTADGKSTQLPKMPKIDVAHALFDRVVPLLR
jgi:phosphopantothenoylcysteine decarboxylase/phosphopantothenate--cysteine ligase